MTIYHNPRRNDNTIPQPQDGTVCPQKKKKGNLGTSLVQENMLDGRTQNCTKLKKKKSPEERVKLITQIPCLKFNGFAYLKKIITPLEKLQKGAVHV